MLWETLFLSIDYRKGAYVCTPLNYRLSHYATAGNRLFYFTTSLRIALAFSLVTRTK